MDIAQSKAATYFHGNARKRLNIGLRSSRAVHSAPLSALSTNMATRTSPELVWGSFWKAFRAERGGGDHPNGSADGK
eukprot:8771391-Alexandrium_andersonii.AAC.1